MYLNKQESYINTSLRDSKRTYTQFCRSQTHPYGPLIIIACIGRCIVNLQYIVLVHVITSEIRVPICHNKEIITPFICITRNNGTPLCIVTCSIKGTEFRLIQIKYQSHMALAISTTNEIYYRKRPIYI